MTLQDFSKIYAKNKTGLFKQINEFFADVVFGVDQWEWRVLLNGKKVLCQKEAVFSVEWTIADKNTAISALNTYGDEMNLDLSSSVQAIQSANGIQLHSVLPFELYKVINKAENSLN